MSDQWILSPSRRLTEEEQSLVWTKPPTHRESVQELRICREVKDNWDRGEMKITNILLEGDAGSGKTQLAKALSADFGLPYTKVTCFADMDKSDVLGSILPVQAEEPGAPVEYRFYPSEIVKAYEHGYLLEIQEPTVIRDAAVLMALNSALEPDGSINLPTRIVHRHPDFIAVITTNRGYNGCRPLNEALRDRVQHTEKMDLPPEDVMVERAAAKTGCTDEMLLRLFARTIMLLDQTAKANAIKGVAGMRSYFYWVDAVIRGVEVVDALYHKVIYKITTDPDEIAILEQSLNVSKVLTELKEVELQRGETNGEVMELRADGNNELGNLDPVAPELPVVALRKSPDSKGQSDKASDSTSTSQSQDTGEDGAPIYHQLQPSKEEMEKRKRTLRKQLNQEARTLVKGSIHENVKLIVHCPEANAAHKDEYDQAASTLNSVVQELVRKTMPLLEHEVSAEHSKSHVYGTQFHADRLAAGDLRYFSKKRPPEEEPSLIVALRIDESASMTAYGRLEAAKLAAVAVYELCSQCGIPLLIYGDTADRSPQEQMSLYAYIDYERTDLNDKYSLMAMQGRSNNRDGMALRILAERLAATSQRTKLLISISDGQPKALSNYSGQTAMEDMQAVLQEYTRKGIQFLAAAIGQDKQIISDIYGQERFLDITDLKQLPSKLLKIIARYL